MRAQLVDDHGEQVGWVELKTYETPEVIMFRDLTYVYRMKRADIYDEGERVHYTVYQEASYKKVIVKDLKKTPPV